MAKPYESNRGPIATPCTDAINPSFQRSESLNNVNFNEKHLGGFSKGAGDSGIETPATDGIKLRNVHNTMPKP